MVFWEGYVSDEAMDCILRRKRRRKIWCLSRQWSRVFCFNSLFKPLLLKALLTSAQTSGKTEQPSMLVQILQIIIAMFVMDTWQYFVHQYMHQNKFLYRHVHSQHHRVVVPYAIGALYNHPLEGLLLDTFGGVISFLVSGMTARTAVVFFCFAVIKTVDDHCGLWLPGNIFHLFFQNNRALSITILSRSSQYGTGFLEHTCYMIW